MIKPDLILQLEKELNIEFKYNFPFLQSKNENESKAIYYTTLSNSKKTEYLSQLEKNRNKCKVL